MHPSHACIRVFVVGIGLSCLLSERNWVGYNGLGISGWNGRVRFCSHLLLMSWEVWDRWTEDNVEAGR